MVNICRCPVINQYLDVPILSDEKIITFEISMQDDRVTRVQIAQSEGCLVQEADLPCVADGDLWEGRRGDKKIIKITKKHKPEMFLFVFFCPEFCFRVFLLFFLFTRSAKKMAVSNCAVYNK